MIGKITIGKSFRGCILYCLNDKIQEPNQEQVMKNRAEVLLFNKCFGNQQELIQQFNEVRRLNTKLSKPVLHITLSLAPGEKLVKNKMAEICEACAKDFGFENNQFIAINHTDTKHQHFHIIANRIGFDTKTVSDSNNYKKIADFCRKIELEYELQKVLNPRKFLTKEMQLKPRLDSRKETLKECIKKTLSESKDYEAFEQKMKAKGYQIIKGRGISFIDNKKVKVKGSEVNFSLQTIEKILEKQEMIPIKKENIHQSFDRNISTGQPGLSLKKEKDLSISELLKKDIAKGLEQLMKPEENLDLFQPSLIKKKRRKKQHRHL
ncbi:MAG: relaxase/mobilization nuclease domain-containing protein [Ginsengibacter sp.]